MTLNQKQQKGSKKRISGFDVVAIISSFGMIGWNITHFFGGMIFYLFVVSYLVVPLIILYLISVIETFISIFRRKTLKVKIVSHSAVILTIIAFNLYDSELFKSKRLITATMADDLSHHTLIFREDGSCEHKLVGLFAYSETYFGKYIIKDDTISFTKKPYDNNFIPDTILISQTDNVIYIEKDVNGDFREVKEWLNHFKIQQ